MPSDPTKDAPRTHRRHVELAARAGRWSGGWPPNVVSSGNRTFWPAQNNVLGVVPRNVDKRSATFDDNPGRDGFRCIPSTCYPSSSSRRQARVDPSAL
jgi:hypothetical protein